jgi:cobalt-precorrin-7 (C5)-methyltransferase
VIICVGVGPGDLGYITNRATKLIGEAEVVAGFDSVLNFIAPLVNKGAEIICMNYKDQVSQIALVAKKHHEGKRCVVALMGDIHFSGFQLLERVQSACGHRVESVPGISSAQILASLTQVCFDETSFITFHRRGDIEPFKRHLVSAIRDGRNAIVIPRPWDFMPHHVAAYLIENDVPAQQTVEVWEKLTQQEAAWVGQLDQVKDVFSDMSIMLIRTLTPFASGLEFEQKAAKDSAHLSQSEQAV